MFRYNSQAEPPAQSQQPLLYTETTIDDNFILSVRKKYKSTIKSLSVLQKNTPDTVFSSGHLGTLRELESKPELLGPELDKFINYIKNFKINDSKIFNLFIFFYVAINTTSTSDEARIKISCVDSTHTFNNHVKHFANVTLYILKNFSPLKKRLEAEFPELKKATERYPNQFPSAVHSYQTLPPRGIATFTPLPLEELQHSLRHHQFSLINSSKHWTKGIIYTSKI